MTMRRGRGLKAEEGCTLLAYRFRREGLPQTSMASRRSVGTALQARGNGVAHISTPAMIAEFMHHEDDDQPNDHQRSPEDPGRLNHALAADSDRFAGAQAAEHGHQVLPD